MLIGAGKHTYEWIDNWAKTPDSDSATTSWAHHGVAITEAGYIITALQDSRTIVVLDKQGNIQNTWDSGLTAAHGITIVKEDKNEYLWLADCGRNRLKEIGYEYPESEQVTGQIIKTTLSGEVVLTLDTPNIPIYHLGDYMPTSVAINEERHDGNGDIWVADGYGQNYVHRYDKSGRYLNSINGKEGDAGLFNCPHGIWIDRRKNEKELYITDRENKQLQIYDLEGLFKRSIGADFLNSPSGFANHKDLLIIAELNARLAILDVNDNLLCLIGDNGEIVDTNGWPNNLNEQALVIPPQLLEPGKFNSPHGIATDNDGNIYIAEWLIGGRYTKLAKL